MATVLPAQCWRWSVAVPCSHRFDPRKRTWREKARRAGIGMSAAMKKAVTLLMEVRATLAPVRFRHSPVLSWGRETTVLSENGKGRAPLEHRLCEQVRHEPNTATGGFLC